MMMEHKGVCWVGLDYVGWVTMKLCRGNHRLVPGYSRE